MANLEVLALDPTTPQIEAPQTGNGYSMPRLVNIAPEAVTGTATTPSLAIAQAWSTTGAATALQVNVTSDTGPSNAAAKLLDLQVGGASKFAVDKTGNISGGVISATKTSYTVFGIGPDVQIGNNYYNIGIGGVDHISLAGSSIAGLFLRNTVNFGWFSGAPAYSNTPDLTLSRDAANTLAQRNGVNAQAFNLYNTYTSGSVYERGVFDWTTTANTLTIGTQKSGTGLTRSVNIVAGGTGYLNIADTASGSNGLTFSSSQDLVYGSFGRILFLNNRSTDIGSGMSVGKQGLAFPDFGGINPSITFRNGYPADGLPNNFSIVGNNAWSAATTNIVGGNLAFNAGAGASSSSGAAHGGNVTIAGGTGYGTGHNGYILMPNLPTSSAGLPTGALWNNMGILSIA